MQARSRTRVPVDITFGTPEDFYNFIMSFEGQAKEFGYSIELKKEEEKLVSNR